MIEVAPGTVAEDVCSKINEKCRISGPDQSRRSLYLALHDAKKVSLSETLFRQLRPEEHLLDLHQTLVARKVPHEFFALLPLRYERPVSPPHSEFGESFFKTGSPRV